MTERIPKAEPFDINDGRNHYQPCPSCKASFGMGLVQRGRHQAVQCDCGHRGQEVETPLIEQWEAWPVPWRERDRQAFEGWNVQSMAAQ